MTVWAVGRDLVGRDAERYLLRSFVDRATRGGAALLLTGEPGVGKSALLRAASEVAEGRGVTVLAAAGVEFEAEVSFAALNQLLLPVLGEWDALAPVHRGALSAALGFASGPVAGRLVVSTAALALLRHVAATRPVLVLVDDLPWVDRASAGVLGFVARRLTGTRIGFLGATRSGTPSFFDSARLPEHVVGPLAAAAATELLRAHFSSLAPDVRQRVTAQAQGNPLALLELPRALPAAGEGTAEAPPAGLPLSRHLQALFAARVRELPPATRRMLLLTTLDGSGDLRALHAAVDSDRWLEHLRPAEDARLLHVDAAARRVALWHPLVGAVAVDLASGEERRWAHGSLAGVPGDDPERRAWHRAEAAESPDAGTADLLDQAARRALRKGDAVRAVSVLLRAADLTPLGPDRARRLAEAAYVGADVTGELREVPRLLAAARRADPELGGSLRAAAATAYHLLNGNGDVDTAHRMLVSAIEATPRSPDDESALYEALHTLLLVCSFSGRDSPWRPFEAAVGRLEPQVPTTLALSATTFADPARAIGATLDRLDTALAHAGDEADPTQVVRLGIAAFYVDRLAGVRDALWRVVRDGRAGGAVASQVSALMMLCHDALETGRWGDAQRWAEEGVELADSHGYRLIAWPGWHCLAVLAAARGDDRTARQRADEMAAWAAPRGARTVEQYAVHARLLAASARGDFEEAYRQATTVGPAGEFPRHVPIALWVALDLVEAAVRTGRRAEAAAHVSALRQLELARLSPRLALVAAGAAGMSDLDGHGAAHFDQALSVPGGESYPFEQARVRLAYGERLRRSREPGAARLQLTAALETFRRLGAAPWAVRAAKELRATSSTRAPADARDRAALTPQEEEIALLAASGLSNKEIAARLYLSPRTVGAHLYRAFPKLGVTARAALRDALTARSPDGGGPSGPRARPA